MICNSRIQNDAAGFVSVEYQGMKGLAQSQERLHLRPDRVYEWRVVEGDDPAWVKTGHEDFDHISVYTHSAREAKPRTEAAGDYELLMPKGVDFAITAGSGRLEQLPPLSVAFIRVNK